MIGINHPGEKAFSGERRPSYWAGNGTLPYVAQHQNMILAVFNIAPNHAVDFIHAAVPFEVFEDYRLEGNWLFARKDEGLVAIWWSNGYEKTTYGANTNKEVIAYGRHQGIYIKGGSMKDYATFDQFVQQMKQLSVHYDGQREMTVIDPHYGLVKMDCTDEWLLNGKKCLVSPKERMVIA